MSSIKKIAGVFAAAAMATGFAASAATPAQAATPRNGVCETGEVCFYYNSNYAGSLSDFTADVANYGTDPATCYVFKSAGAGQGLCIKNEVASVRNLSGKAVKVFFNSSYGGTYQTIGANSAANLNATMKNNNASHQFVPTTQPPTGGGYPVKVGDDYPYRGATTGVDPWNFYKGQCTSFAAWTVNSRLGLPFHNAYKGVHWGNAINWDNAARSAGIPVSGTPRVGDIAVRNSGTWGHVALVTKVNSNGTFEVDEYNHVKPDTYAHRTSSIGAASNQFDQFIHFR